LTQEEIESAGFGYSYGALAAMSKQYDITKLKDGWNTYDEREFYFVGNPALGLWATESRFANSDSS
jgi:hypothetical protein